MSLFSAFIISCFILSYSFCAKIQQTPINNFSNQFHNRNLQSATCLKTVNSVCVSCISAYVLWNNTCIQSISECISQTGQLCKSCQDGFELILNNLTLISNNSITQSNLNLIQKLGLTNYFGYLQNFSMNDSPITICSKINIINSNNNNTNQTQIVSSTQNIITGIVAATPPSTLLTSQQVINSHPILDMSPSLMRQSFINWQKVPLIYKTDVYLILTLHELSGYQTINTYFDQQTSILQAAVSGEVQVITSTITILQWVISNQLINFQQGNIIDIMSVYFYRILYTTGQNQYEALTMIHKYNYKINILKISLINSTSPTANVTNIQTNLTLQAKIVTLNQQLQQLKLKILQINSVQNSQQDQLLSYFGYQPISNISRSQDIGCLIIQNYYITNNLQSVVSLIQNQNAKLINNYSNIELLITKFYLNSNSVGGSITTTHDYLAKLSVNSLYTALIQVKFDRFYNIVGVFCIYKMQ